MALATNIIESIKSEHQVVRNLWEEFKIQTEPAAKQQLCWELIRQMSVHGSKEEEVLYPALEKKFGKDHTEQLLQHHLELKKKMQMMDRLKVETDDAQLTKLTNEALEFFFKHVEVEEGQELPALEELGPEAMESLNVAWAEAAMHANTRPHPELPIRPPDCIEAHKRTAALDAAEDQFRFSGVGITTGSAAAP